MDLNQLCALALQGDRTALEELCAQIRQPIFRLAWRMLGSPHDAEDATQEILVLIIAHLDQLEGRAQFNTWMYTIATRVLLRTRKRQAESAVRGAQAFAEWLDEHLADDAYTPAQEAELKLLEDECRLSCTQGMLLCLSREQRIALILGDMLQLSDVVGAEICQISRATFRQRLARARQVIRSIVARRCGLVDEQNPCHCSKQISACIKHGFIDPQHLNLANTPRKHILLEQAAQLDAIERFGQLLAADELLAPEHIWLELQKRAPAFVATPDATTT